MNTLVTYFFGGIHAKQEAQLFRRGLYAFVLVKCIYWIVDFGSLLGNESIVTKNNVQLSAIRSAGFFLFNSGSDAIAWAAIVLTVLVFGFSLFSGRFHRLLAFAGWLLIVNINNRIYPTLSGGDFLLQQLLFFNIFLSGYRSSQVAEWEVALHNTGVSAVKFQICLVYFISALAKLGDINWMHGDALSQTLMIKDFSLPFLYESNGSSSSLTGIAGYFVIAYQLLFPVLIWIKKIKPFLICTGILQHLFIAFVMGLPTFGFVMIVSYAIFYSPRSGKIA